MKRKALSILLSLCIVLSILPVSVPALDVPSEAYPDTQGHWAEGSIAKWSLEGILKGAGGLFRPNDPITRAELAALLNRVIGYTALTNTAFADVPSNAWYYEDIAKLYAAGILAGDGKGVMRPTANITREEAAVLFARAFDVEENAGNENPFPDAANISGWASFLVDGMKAAGYISGDTNGNFNPKANITRAEAVTILNNISANYYGTAGEYTGDVKGNVVVSAADVTLKNMKITGDLYIMEGVGEGDVTLENVEVTGRILARGGGANSLYIKNCKINSFIATKDELHVVFSNGTKISFLKADIKDGSIELLGCTVETMTVIGDGLTVKLDGKSSVVTLNADANQTTIQGESGAVISTANLGGQTEITGKVKITEANIKADGCTIEQTPAKTNLDDGIKVEINGKEVIGGEATPPAVGGGSGGGNSGAAVTFKSHNVPNRPNVPYGTVFSQLDFPEEVTLTASNGNTVLVQIVWVDNVYNPQMTGGVQTITGTVSAKSGEALPDWAPASISVSVTVLPMPTPTTLEICSSSAGEVVIDASIVKGGSEDYFLRVKDENGTIMTAAQLADAGVSWDFGEETSGITITHNAQNITIAIAGSYGEERYIFTAELRYTCNNGGKLTDTLSIATPEKPAGMVAAVTNVELFAEAEGSDMPETLHIKFLEPADVTGIQAFEVQLHSVQDATSYTVLRTYAPTGNQAMHEYGIVRAVSMAPSGTYKVVVVSISQIDDGYNSSAECASRIEHTALGLQHNNLLPEKVIYSALEGAGEQGSVFMDVFIDYHYRGMLVPEIDTLLVDIYFENAPRYAPRSVFGAESDVKGRVHTVTELPEGAAINMSDFRIEISRYILDMGGDGETISLATTNPVTISYDSMMFEQMDLGNSWPGNRAGWTSYLDTISNKSTGTAFAALGLPEKVTLHAANGPSFGPASQIEVDIEWNVSDYDSSSSEPQTIRGYVVPELNTEYPAWVPEVITIEVQLQG